MWINILLVFDYEFGFDESVSKLCSDKREKVWFVYLKRKRDPSDVKL